MVRRPKRGIGVGCGGATDPAVAVAEFSRVSESIGKRLDAEEGHINCILGTEERASQQRGLFVVEAEFSVEAIPAR